MGFDHLEKMEKRVGVGFFVLGFLLTIMPMPVAVTVRLFDFEEARRYLLANDLGITPPMG